MARRGFSFTEILFAVMILGIGFIMVAAMFPVAIHQTEANNQETVAASLGTTGVDVLAKTGQILFPYNTTTAESMLSLTFSTAPPTPTLSANPPQTTVTIPGQVWSMYDSRDTRNGNTHAQALWQSVGKNLIQASDRRFGWIALYKRDVIASGTPGAAATSFAYAPYAQVIVFGVQSRNRGAYLPADVNVATPTAGLLMPQFSPGAILTPATASNPFSTIQIASGAGVVSEGSFVVVSDDHNGGGANGHIYRIGVQQSASTGQFAPGEGMGPNDVALNNADVFIVGPGYDPGTNTIHGPSEAVSVYTTYVAVPQ